MTNILDNFELFSKVSDELKLQIKVFHAFDDDNGYNILFITSDDTVYGFGSNSMGCCGLGHNKRIDSPLIIPELCNKNIKQFFNGYSFMLALNCDKQLYGWGDNSLGQLGIGILNTDNEYLKPVIIELLNEKQIIDISCGSAHSLVLTHNGLVFGWGSNTYGQIGCGKQTPELISTPIQLKSFTNSQIKAIHCCYCHSFVLTNDGLVYSFGSNSYCSLGHESEQNVCIFEPKLINISNIIYVCPSRANTHFLTNEGLVYFCGRYEEMFGLIYNYQKLPIILNNENKFTSLYSIPFYQKGISIASAVTEEYIYSLNSNLISKTKSKELFDYYSEEYQMTYKTIDIKEFYNQNRFDVSFKEVTLIGLGGFGSVFKAKLKSNEINYAIKKFVFNEIDGNSKKNIVKEMEVLSKCNADYVVHYYDSWFEKSCFYIQMELCFDNLKNILKEKPKCFGRETSQSMNLIEFFISSQLFKEVLECVQYLHELKPNPIIHRDLKSENILVTEKSRNGRFIKLCDFGFETFDDMDQTVLNTLNTRTNKYKAPVILNRSDQKTGYTIKANIFSLGLISSEIFDFDINSSSQTITGNPELTSKWNSLHEICGKMLETKYIFSLRPTCSEILAKFDLWAIKSIQQKQKESENYLENVLQIKSFSNRFFYKYFREKLVY